MTTIPVDDENGVIGAVREVMVIESWEKPSVMYPSGRIATSIPAVYLKDENGDYVYGEDDLPVVLVPGVLLNLQTLPYKKACKAPFEVIP